MKLTNIEMQNVDGGVSWGIIAGIASALVYVIGFFSGYTNPSRCSN